MRISAHLLQQIVGRPVAHFSGSGHKRALGRVTLETPATIFPMHGELLDNPIQVTAQDISAETVGLVSSEAMMPSANFAIRFSLADGEALAIHCRVTRCVQQAAGQFALAAEFVELMDVQSLERQSESET